MYACHDAFAIRNNHAHPEDRALVNEECMVCDEIEINIVLHEPATILLCVQQRFFSIALKTNFLRWIEIPDMQHDGVFASESLNTVRCIRQETAEKIEHIKYCKKY